MQTDSAAAKRHVACRQVLQKMQQEGNIARWKQTQEKYTVVFKSGEEVDLDGGTPAAIREEVDDARHPYRYTRSRMGQRFRITTDEGQRHEGVVVDFQPCQLVNTETGEGYRGAVKLIVEDDDGRRHTSACMAPAI